LGKRVYAIVNYDNFAIDPALLDRYSAMVRGLMDNYYAEVTRYTTSGFLRMKLGDALEKRGVAPHIYESAAEAEKSLQEIEGGWHEGATTT
jgi:propionate CoA-transferase